MTNEDEGRAREVMTVKIRESLRAFCEVDGDDLAQSVVIACLFNSPDKTVKEADFAVILREVSDMHTMAISLDLMLAGIVRWSVEDGKLHLTIIDPERAKSLLEMR